MLDNILINWFKKWSWKKRNWLSHLINIAEHEVREEAHTITDVTDEFMEDLSRFDMEDFIHAQR